MATLTTNYSLIKPAVNSATDEDQWGDELNTDLNSLDTLLRSGITIATQISQTTGFTADASISVKKLYPCDATSAGFTATIPAAATAGNGAMVFIKKTDTSSNVVTLARSASDTLDGDTSLSLTAENDSYGLVSDGVSRWNTICNVTINDATTSIKGIVELATAAETLLGSDTTRAITPAGFAGNITNSFSAGLGQASYGLPGGYILKFGALNDSGSTGSVSFTAAFPNNIFVVIATRRNDNDVAQYMITLNKSTSGFSWRVNASPGTGVDWVAIGN